MDKLSACANAYLRMMELTYRIDFLDVGQGDATLIVCDGKAMLIDAGDDSKGTIVQNYLQKQNVKNLDYLALTHPDSDHIGGAPAYILNAKSKKFHRPSCGSLPADGQESAESREKLIAQGYEPCWKCKP